MDWQEVGKGEDARDAIVNAGFQEMDRIGVRYRDERGEEREGVGFYGPGIGVIVRGSWIPYPQVIAFRRAARQEAAG